MPEETPEQTDQKINVTNGQICTAVVGAYCTFAAIYNFRVRAHNRKVEKKNAAIRDRNAANQKQTVETVDELIAALHETPPMYFCNN